MPTARNAVGWFRFTMMGDQGTDETPTRGAQNRWVERVVDEHGREFATLTYRRAGSRVTSSAEVPANRTSVHYGSVHP
jgi:hypothetical protein